MISFRPLIWFAIFVPGMLAQVSVPTPTPKQIFPISGQVVNAVTGEPLSKTEIAISPIENREKLQSVISNEEGQFSFPAVRPGKYLLVGARKNFRQQLYDEHEGLSTAIAVGGGLNSENLVFRLKPDASISGTIADDQGEPIENAQVLLLHETAINGVACTEVEDSALSDEDGYYHFGHLAAGRYFVSYIAKPWYAPEPSTSLAAPEDEELATKYRLLWEGSPFDVTYPRSFYSEGTDAPRATAIMLSPGERRVADMTLIAVPSVHIRVKVPSDPDITAQISVAQSLINGVERLIPARVERISPDFVEVSGLAPGRYALRILLANDRKTVEIDKAVNATRNIEIEIGRAHV